MPTADQFPLRHHAQRSATNADQAEFLAIKNGTVVVGAGILDDSAAGAMEDFEAPEVSTTASWQEMDLKFDEAVRTTHEEVDRRAATLGKIYPFTSDKGTLIYEPSKNLVYEFLLAICNAETLTKGNHVELPRFFERLSAKLVASYFGPEAKSIHTGSPRDSEIGISFKDAMTTVAAQTGEWTWGPKPDLPSEQKLGDSGCDFVVWPPAADNRKIGQLFILGQCACGNNWQDKFHDLSISGLAKWFNPLSSVHPVRSFATPFYVTDEMLPEASRLAGVVFDRARLASIGYEAPSEVIDDEMRERMRTLIRLAC